MNAATILGTVLSLILAATMAGNTCGVNSTDRPAPPGQNLNHNETFVRDATENRKPNALSLWLTPEASVVAPVFIQVAYIGAGCSPWICGANHNETLLHAAR